jgi:ArsR family transcriptional regulator
MKRMRNLVMAAKALSDPNRIRILEALRGGELCVCELCEGLRMTQSTLSTHLAVLRRAGLATVRKHGRWAYYQLHPRGLGLIEALFPRYSGELSRDRRLSVDRRRLGRSGRRQDGLCNGTPPPQRRGENPGKPKAT